MATVADRSRARKARAPRPAPAPSPAVLPEGWQPGGAAPPVAPPPVGPAERHGKCSLRLSIGGTGYKLRPASPPAGLAVIWTLVKIQSDRADGPRAYAVASDGRDVRCTCPDHTINGARCKHIGALVALRLIVLPAPPPVAAPVGPAAPSPAEEFQSAVKREIRRKRGEWGPCECCRVEISPAESYAPGRFLCGDCFEGGAR